MLSCVDLHLLLGPGDFSGQNLDSSRYLNDMDLPSTYHFQGWDVRYSLARSNNALASDRQQVNSVVFVHGTPWSSAVFRPVVEALLAKESYQILVYDLPCYGQSQDSHLDSSTTTSEEDFLGDTSVCEILG